MLPDINYQRYFITSSRLRSGITNIVFCTTTHSVCLIGVFYDSAFFVIYKNSMYVLKKTVGVPGVMWL
jgi:hypothetical protein